MKKITIKVITISSQLLVVFVFLFLLFGTMGSNKNVVTVNNDNFDKMADRTLVLFEKEEKVDLSDDTLEPLDDENTKVLEEVEETKEEDIKATEEEKVVPVVTPSVDLFYDREVIKTEVGTITGYGPDCYGCSGMTASGHNLWESIYYDDSEYGTVRILAADKSIPFYSIFRVSNIPGMDPFIAIVLDTGGNVGYGRGTLFDLAFESEQGEVVPKTPNVTFEMLRSGK